MAYDGTPNIDGLSHLRSHAAAQTAYAVCGFFTRDYWPWVPVLQASLDRVDCSHDFVECAKVDGGWERNTLRKPFEVADAMKRHPQSVVVFVDVDCTVAGSLAPLANLSGDVAVRMRVRTKATRAGGAYRLHCNTGTIVLRPTAGARAFVELWCKASEAARYGDVDQTTFLVAMAASTHTTFQPLEEKWSSREGDPNGIILHDQGSRTLRKIGRIDRFIHQLKGAFLRQRAP